MTVTTIEQQIADRVHNLDKEYQRRVLEYILSLQSRPAGEPGHLLVQHAREINFPHEDLEEMRRAIEEDCEEVDWNEWT